MNKQLLCAALAAALCAACAQQPKDRFTLSGSVEGMDGQYVYLMYGADTLSVTDSALVEAGAFRFEGKLLAPTKAMLHPKLETQAYDPKKIYSFYIEPASMTVTLDPADLSKSRLEGSLTQAQVDSLEVQREAILSEAKAIRDSLEAETDPVKHAELQDRLEPYNERANKLYGAFISTHPASYASVDYLAFYKNTISYDEIKPLYEGLTPEVQATFAGKEVAKELETLARVQPGQPAPDFAKEDVNGKPFRLSDLRGKYVVIDFWASWCVPCRKSNPHMKEMYAKWHDKGLEYVYVADNDSNPDNWRKAIKEDGLEAFHHVLRGLKVDRSNGGYKFDRTNDISEKYAIHFLPTKYLIDREGKIVGKFESDELEAKLKEIFE